MKTKQEHINFWIEQANDDWSAVDTLYKGKKYLQALFFAHLVIEKECKALWIKHNSGNVPPRTHNLFAFRHSNSIFRRNRGIYVEFKQVPIRRKVSGLFD